MPGTLGDFKHSICVLRWSFPVLLWSFPFLLGVESLFFVLHRGIQDSGEEVGV